MIKPITGGTTVSITENRRHSHLRVLRGGRAPNIAKPGTKLMASYTGAVGQDSRRSVPSWLRAVVAEEGYARGISVSIVVPYYRPGPAISRHLAELFDVLDRSGASFEVIAVSDGSDELSQAAVASLERPELIHIKLPMNQGKGAALRRGMVVARGQWVGFIDADGDIPAPLMGYFIALAIRGEGDVLIGSKQHPWSEVELSRTRRITSAIYRGMIKLMFGLSVRDTQTGIKLFRAGVLSAVLPACREDGFAFDLEVLALCASMGQVRIKELPVVIRDRTCSTISLRSVLRMTRDTFGVFLRKHSACGLLEQRLSAGVVRESGDEFLL